MLRENMGKRSKTLVQAIIFWIGSQKLKNLKENVDEWDCIKLKGFCTTKEAINRMKRQPAAWEKIFTSYTFHKELISRIYKELKKTE
jgi:hypothetical protein